MIFNPEMMKTIHLFILGFAMVLVGCDKSPSVHQGGHNVQTPAGFDGSQESLVPGSRH